MAKIIEYNPRKTKHSRKTKNQDKTAKRVKPAKRGKVFRNPFSGKSSANKMELVKDGALTAGGFLGAWASNKYLWSMLPSSISASTSLVKIRGLIPAILGIFLAGKKNPAGKKIGLGLVAGGVYDMLAGVSSGMVPTLGAERVVYRPVPVRTVGFEARKTATVGYEAPRLAGSLPTARTPFVRGSLANAGRSTLTGVGVI